MNALVLQCGGPTTVVNTTLAALVRRWRDRGDGRLLGGRFGLAALLSGGWVPLAADESNETWISGIESSPGMALGGGRDRLTQPQADVALSRLAGADILLLFLIGGGGTMAAGRAIAARAAVARVPLRVVGIPKTIDNDIPQTDVCPGFPSAARFLVDAVRDIAADASSMRGYEDVVLIEAMGRHSGWLAVSTLLARTSAGDAPHLVLIPEQPFHEQSFLDAVRDQHRRAGTCIVTVAEGVRNAAGVFLAELCAPHGVERDASGQIILGRSGGPLPFLAWLVRERLGLRCRLVRPDVLQRCSVAHVTPLDRHLAGEVGKAAVDLAPEVQPEDPVMIALRRRNGGWETVPVPLDRVRGERTLPAGLARDPRPLRVYLA